MAAEQSTAAVDVADTSGDEPLAAKADEATADGAEAQQKADTDADTAHTDEESDQSESDVSPPDLHSGHKLARRYRLEECVTRLDGFSSWRAVDEKLRRAVGVHVLPSNHPRARPALAAARSAALLGDPRFVQVLDAVEENDLVYIVHEWLSDATELTAVLATGPLEPHDAYQLVSQLAGAMAAAHREGLAHLRLTPGSVLRTDGGQYRVRGLAVMAALRGITADDPQRADTEAIGALLYASLTQRWPYSEDAYGLTGLPKDVGLVAPDQVRAGVHRGLSELAMRALVNDGATASRQGQACTTPDELSKAVTAMPRVRPPEPSFAAAPAYQRATYRPGTYGQRPVHGPAAAPVASPAPTPPLQTRTGKVVKWAVSALLIVALGLGSWQLADALLKGEEKPGDDKNSGNSADGAPNKKPTKPLKIVDAAEYYPDGQPQNVDQVPSTYDGDSSTYWRTKSYVDGPDLDPNFKKGVGIVYDLGATKEISGASVKLHYASSGDDHTTTTLYAASSLDSGAPLSAMKKLDTVTTASTTAKMSLKKPAKTRYVLLWMTAMPHGQAEGYNKAGYRQAITDVRFTG